MHQSQSPLVSFGSSRKRMRAALAAARAGRGVLVVDDEDRENEGDLIFPAQFLSVPQMAMLIRYCSGIVCLCLTEERLRRLNLPMMTEVNTNAHGTAFTVSIEAANGVSHRRLGRRPRGNCAGRHPDGRLPGGSAPPRPCFPSTRTARRGVGKARAHRGHCRFDDSGRS